MSKLKDKVSARRNKTRQESVFIPELKTDLPCKGVTSFVMETWRMYRRDPKLMSPQLSNAYLIQQGLLDENGRLMYSGEELNLIAELPAAITEPVSAKILELSGYGDVAQAAIVKNLPKTSTDSGSSD
jgi:hypothetical protein